MRGIWQLAILAAVIGAVLVVSGFLLLEHGGTNKSSKPGSQPIPNVSSGNDSISAKAPQEGKYPYNRTVVVRVKNRATGAPVHGAKVVIHGEMTIPHEMTLYEKNLREVSRGEYKGPYTLIMPGNWRVVIVARTKKGGASTYTLPVHVIG